MTNWDVYHYCSAMLFHEQGTLVCTMCMSIDCQGCEVDFKLKNKGEHDPEYQMRRPVEDLHSTLLWLVLWCNSHDGLP